MGKGKKEQEAGLGVRKEEEWGREEEVARTKDG
jgi:hypothetical protein